ncbi:MULTISPECIES: LysE family translocator [Paraburkholderia]|uniref:Threonine/homoserine/homoserine lactone efflux protein n=1 Tax=Paraburkholderia tropica TaxID=92647 RepID=A0ABX5MUG1_9BURK|nr:LysE family translocator [Paraburkholderia tropica]MBB2999255.1 threonine/homoserine/homoserine lactone efflux protein [Paraburkholderia tropica]MBB6318845.1 threonine/homoserine/homoserine lactone efflux protein [Paraburkholderia tropica]MDE1138982.1 LysE family translocator [Paraburkholderia tropica]PXX18648.1 threonine/homoserine/homoserine lactone efflux protein [Paraburkholderia tropica]PZW87180.1 threonine/homoserine/homoserine lactone efflux protein [Paraburkholderia tropica]
MNVSSALIAILTALLLGAISPGPSFILVVRSSLGLSRRDGLATAIGMGVGGVCFSGIALAGLYTLLNSVEWLYGGLKMAGGAYLIYLALKIWRGSSESIVIDRIRTEAAHSLGRSFWTGLTTQLTNPKTAIVYGSIFAALLPQHPPLWCYVALPPLVFAVEAGWYATVAVCFSGHVLRDRYLKSRVWIDRCASAAIAALGLRLMFSVYKRA